MDWIECWAFRPCTISIKLMGNSLRSTLVRVNPRSQAQSYTCTKILLRKWKILSSKWKILLRKWKILLRKCRDKNKPVCYSNCHWPAETHSIIYLHKNPFEEMKRPFLLWPRETSSIIQNPFEVMKDLYYRYENMDHF